MIIVYTIYFMVVAIVIIAFAAYVSTIGEGQSLAEAIKEIEPKTVNKLTDEKIDHYLSLWFDRMVSGNYDEAQGCMNLLEVEVVTAYNAGQYYTPYSLKTKKAKYERMYNSYIHTVDNLDYIAISFIKSMESRPIIFEKNP